MKILNWSLKIALFRFSHKEYEISSLKSILQNGRRYNCWVLDHLLTEIGDVSVLLMCQWHDVYILCGDWRPPRHQLSLSPLAITLQPGERSQAYRHHYCELLPQIVSPVAGLGLPPAISHWPHTFLYNNNLLCLAQTFLCKHSSFLIVPSSETLPAD